jgi:hypothetical protein
MGARAIFVFALAFGYFWPSTVGAKPLLNLPAAWRRLDGFVSCDQIALSCRVGRCEVLLKRCQSIVRCVLILNQVKVL